MPTPAARSIDLKDDDCVEITPQIAAIEQTQGAHYTSEENIMKVIGPLFLDEMQAQAEDPSIIYRVADSPSRHLLREVLPLGIDPSKKGR